MKLNIRFEDGSSSNFDTNKKVKSVKEFTKLKRQIWKEITNKSEFDYSDQFIIKTLDAKKIINEEFKKFLKGI